LTSVCGDCDPNVLWIHAARARVRVRVRMCVRWGLFYNNIQHTIYVTHNVDVIYIFTAVVM